MNIKRIGNVILAVKDLDESIKFYHDTLGMPIKNSNKKFKYFGNPTRYENTIIKKKLYKQKKINILVIGGSLGAKIFNEIIPQAIYSLKKDFFIERSKILNS